MNLGTENSKKTMIAIGLAVVALFMTARMFYSSFSGPSSPAATTTNAAAQPQPAKRAPARRGGTRRGNAGPVTPGLDPRLKLALLNETENLEYTGKGRNIFKANADEPVEIPKPVVNPLKDRAKVEPPPPQQYTPPPPPPIPLKFFGFASQQGTKKVLLLSGEDVFVATEGEIVQRRYKIMKINANNIEVMDVLSNNRQTIPLTAG